MAPRTVVGRVESPGGEGFPCVGARVVAELYSAGELAYGESGDVAVGSVATLTTSSGTWGLELEPNSLIEPTGTVWRIAVTTPARASSTFYVSVPDSAGPHNAVDILAELPGALPSEALAAHAALSSAHGAGSSIVGVSDTQTLSNKTLASPVVTGSITATSPVAFNIRESLHLERARCVDARDYESPQAAIDAAISSAASVVRFGPGPMSIAQSLVVADASGLVLDGNGVTLGMQPTGSRYHAIRFAGTCERVVVRGFNIVGSGDPADGHAGIGCGDGVTVDRCSITGNSISDVTLGISFDLPTSGALADVSVSDNDLANIVGASSGYGYGIHVSSAQADAMRMAIANNRVSSAQRHAIYVAMAVGVDVHGNSISNHRDAANDGNIRPAILVARSKAVAVVGNSVHGGAGGGVMVGGWYPNPNSWSEGYTVSDNVIVDPADAVAGIYVGQDTPSVDGYPTGVVVSGNVVVSRGSNSGGVYIHNGKQVRIAGNLIALMSNTSSTSAVRVASAGDSSSSLYMDEITISGNSIHVDTSSGAAVAIRLSGAETVTAAMTFDGNVCNTAASMFAASGTVTNPNLVVRNQSTAGLAYSGGVAPSLGLQRSSSLPAASSFWRSQMVVKSGGGAEDKVCVCVLSSDGSTYKWIDVKDGSTVA